MFHSFLTMLVFRMIEVMDLTTGEVHYEMNPTGKIIIAVSLVIVLLIVIKHIRKTNAAKKSQINRLLSQISTKDREIQTTKAQLDQKLAAFFVSNSTEGYSAVHTTLEQMLNLMKSSISEMQSMNGRLVSLSRNEDRSSQLNTITTNCVAPAIVLVDGLAAFGRKVMSLPASVMMQEASYGKNNKPYWDEVTAMNRSDAVAYISRCENLLNGTDYRGMYSIEPDKVLKCVWFFATEKTFSASDFQKAERVFTRIYKNSHSDVIIADMYAKKKMGGEDVLRDTIRDLLKIEQDSQKLTRIASALMWMNAYQSENTVLQHMLTSGKEMTAKTQERLHSLTNGGGKAPSGFEVKSRVNELYFDVSALAWKDDEYIGLFENLAFQDKILTYSLALREENKDLFIPQGVQVPDSAKVLNKLNTVFAEEYGTGVTARTVNCIALSGSGEEKMDGILASSGECKQMGVLIHIARIGKKLIIKFYTLFMPDGTDLAAQKHQALSMYKKLSPTVTMWEGSLKDTMLMAVEQLLNASAQSGSAPASTPVVNTDETVF